MPVFHVDSVNGDDSHDGKSPASAFRTLRRAGREPLKAGDSVLLKRGCEWAEPMRLRGKGSADAPLTLGAYGDGLRPRILVGDVSGVSADEPVSGWVISGLEIAGARACHPSGREPGKVCGVALHQSGPCADLRIEDCLIRDVDGAGISLTAGESDSPVFTGAVVANCEIRNASTGITFGGPWPPSGESTHYHEKFLVTNCLVHEIGTDPIVLSHCRDGSIEHCTAFRGGLGVTKRSPVGIWYFMARRCVIQYCESFDNHTAGCTADGGGFDLDGGAMDCVMQYNFSHDNDGAGYLICSYDPKNAPCEGCVTRFNVSVNDGLANDYPSIDFWQADRCLTYNNTCVTRKSSPLKFISDTQGHLIANNAFIVNSSEDIPVVKSAFAVDRNRFRNNLYWRTGGQARFEIMEEKALDFPAFRKLVKGERELAEDPGLSALLGRDLHPLPGSPLLGAGEAVPDMGDRDFHGLKIEAGKPLNIGCSLKRP